MSNLPTITREDAIRSYQSTGFRICEQPGNEKGVKIFQTIEEFLLQKALILLAQC